MNNIQSHFSQVNLQINATLNSDVALINQLSTYIINSGGKRLRPKLVLLSALSCGYKGNKHIKLAAIIEFIHTATLLHDDVVDGSNLRRGKETANTVFGNQAAVLTGDFLYSRAFQIMSEVNSLKVMSILADTTNLIAEGEVLQLLNTGEINLNEDDYFSVIYRKTAKLFETSCLLGAVISKQNDKVCTSLSNYGKYLGNAFQMIDDVLDYQSDSDTMGKNIGDDLAEGKVTLPLIYALTHANKSQKILITNAIKNTSTKHIDKIVNILEQTGAIRYTAKLAKQQLELAVKSIANIQDSIYKDELIKIAKQSLNRVS